jgi:pimeloyl-ACP methyl ester carboxylesterase
MIDRCVQTIGRALAGLVVGLSIGAASIGPTAASEDTRIAAETLARAKPGTIFRVWPMEGGVKPGIKGYRVLYRSTNFDGRPVAVTGALIFPEEKSARPRAVVAWAHPTTGVVSKCAPTLLPNLSQVVMGLDEMTDRGWVVAATDYIGLGTGGTHPYLIGIAEANAVLDIVRAARQLSDIQAGDRFAVWGHSQGGHAAIYTGLHARTYAPDLNLVGVAAAAPATKLAELFEADAHTSSGRSLSAMTVLAWSRVFGWPLGDLVEPAAERAFERLANDCIEDLPDFFKEDADEKALPRVFLKIDPLTDPRFAPVIIANTPGPLPAGLPVFIAQGTADTVVRPAITKQYVGELCRGGALVKMHVLSGVSHVTIALDSAYDAVEWMAHRFEDRPAPSQC